MNHSLVSVVCLCYNHATYLEEAIRSVLVQTHPNIQLIIVDDHSSDDSVEIIKKITAENPSVDFIPLAENQGNCKAFNSGFARAKGNFIIDLSADDALMPDRIESGLKILEANGNIGVTFSDAMLVDGSDRKLGYHSDRFPHPTIPQGDVYKEVLSRYFINSPTMMVRREVFEALGGYDENLAYEDFDFWVRSSRTFHYHYEPLPLVKRRVLDSSMGKSQYKKSSGIMRSTFVVCEKALVLNRTSGEQDALKKRIRYEARKALFAGDMGLVWDYFKLWRKVP